MGLGFFFPFSVRKKLLLIAECTGRCKNTELKNVLKMLLNISHIGWEQVNMRTQKGFHLVK